MADEVIEGIFEGVVLECFGIIVDVIVFLAVEGDKEDGILDPFCVVVEEIEIDDDELTRVVETVKSGVVETCFVIVTTVSVSVLDVSLMRDVGLEAVGEVLVKAVGVELILEVDE